MRFIDIYALIDKYEKKVIESFLSNYVEGFEQAADFYEYPQYSDAPVFSTGSIVEMINFLVNRESCEYTLYWNNISEGEVINGMIFFCNDSSLIIGLSVIPELENLYLDKLKTDFHTQYCLSSIEERPPLNANEFKKMAEARRGEKSHP